MQLSLESKVLCMVRDCPDKCCQVSLINYDVYELRIRKTTFEYTCIEFQFYFQRKVWGITNCGLLYK
jgi:hypothetical protein